MKTTNPHTLISDGTDLEKEARGYVKSIVDPIFKKVLHEAEKNRLSVGGGSVSGVTTNSRYVLYCPHNYRLYIDFSRTGYSPLLCGGDAKTDPQGSVVTTVNGVKVNMRVVNSKEHCYELIGGCRVVVKKTQVEITNKVDEGRWYPVELGSVDGIRERIASIVLKKEQECISALQGLISAFGGTSGFRILNAVHEEKIKHEHVVDLLPMKMKLHSDVVKKVYNEANVEFSSPVFAVNFLRSRAIEDIAPQIASAINGLADTVLSPVEGLKARISCLSDVFLFEKVIKRLSEAHRLELSSWITEHFGGAPGG